MKRRSARPVVVEVKRTRIANASLANAFGRSPNAKDLWQGVRLREAPQPSDEQPLVPAASEPAIVEEPVRRVLPALTPMFALSQEEPQDDVTETPPLPRRVKFERKPRQQRILPEASGLRTMPEAALDLVDALLPVPEPRTARESVLAKPPLVERIANVRLARRQDHPELPRGERWKRRLPRSCW